MLDKDNFEYVQYLQSKKTEKLNAIKQLSNTRRSNVENYTKVKEDLKAKHESEINSINLQIFDYEQKLLEKQKEFTSLQAIVDKRTKHNSEIAVVKSELDQSNSAFQIKLAELEDQLLKERIVLQADSERKISDIRLHANEKAVEFLAEYCASIKNENKELEKELADLTKSTSELTEKKEKLRLSLMDVEREGRVKAGVIMARMKKIDEAEKKNIKEKIETKAEHIRRTLDIAKLIMLKKDLTSEKWQYETSDSDE